MARPSLGEFLRDKPVFSTVRIAQLEQDIVDLQKVAAFLPAVGNYLKASIPALASIMITSAGSAGLAYWAASKRMGEHKQSLKDSYDMTFGGSPKFKKSPGDFHQRFTELSMISPLVASNPQLASKVILPRLKKGFDLNDVHRLSAIEYHSGSSSRPEAPSAAARAQAVIGAGNALNYILPSLATRAVNHITESAAGPSPTVLKMEQGKEPESREAYDRMIKNVSTYMPSPARDQALNEAASTFASQGHPPELILKKMQILQDEFDKKWAKTQVVYENYPNETVRKAYHEFLELAKKQHQLNKQGAEKMAHRVSDECLGQMLAETHLMCKEAGVMTSISKYLAPSAKNVANYMKAMTIPLAMGIGIKAVQGLLDSRNKSELKNEAARVYASLKRTSDVIKENPQIADQAFDALTSFAPALAVKPIIAKTFVENVVNGQGVLDPNTANMLAQTQQTVQSLDRQTGGFVTGLRDSMGIFNFKVPGKKEDKK